MRITFVLGALGALVITGCAHHQGEVAMKINDKEAHVGLGSDDVALGDRVTLYREDCDRSADDGARGRKASHCRTVRVGEGEIIRHLNKDYSVMRVDPGVAFDEGTIVTKDQQKVSH